MVISITHRGGSGLIHLSGASPTAFPVWWGHKQVNKLLFYCFFLPAGLSEIKPFLSMFIFFVRTCQIAFDDRDGRQKTNAVRTIGRTLQGSIQDFYLGGLF